MPTDTATAAHGACGAKNRHGGACQLRAGFGTNHVGVGRCKHHGGASPNGQKHAQIAAAELALQKAGVAVPTDPARGLLDMVASSAGMVRYLAAKTAELDEITAMTAFGPAVRPEPMLLEKWVKLHARNCKLALDANISERYVRLAEDQGRLVVELIQRVLGKAELEPGQRQTLERLFGQEMRVMAAASPELS